MFEKIASRLNRSDFQMIEQSNGVYRVSYGRVVAYVITANNEIVDIWFD